MIKMHEEGSFHRRHLRRTKGVELLERANRGMIGLPERQLEEETCPSSCNPTQRRCREF
jgi:hypothetical protein